MLRRGRELKHSRYLSSYKLHLLITPLSLTCFSLSRYLGSGPWVLRTFSSFFSPLGRHISGVNLKSRFFQCALILFLKALINLDSTTHVSAIRREKLYFLMLFLDLGSREIFVFTFHTVT